MLPIKRNCRFLIDKEKGKPDGRLRYRIRWDGKVAIFMVGYRVNIDKWIPDAQRCKVNTTHGEERISATEINQAIQNMEDIIDDLFYGYEQEDRIPSYKELKDDYNKIVENSKTPAEVETIEDLFDLFIEDQSKKNAWTKGTKNRINVVKNHIKLFNKEIKLNSISEDSFQSFIDYQVKKKFKNPTIEKNHKTFISVVRWAEEKGLIKTNAHKTFKPKFKGTNTKEVIYLTWDELMKLHAFDFGKKEYLNRTRDVFCFCCFTGLRYSDVQNLTVDEVFEDYIEIVTQKTLDRLKIELNDFSKGILNKYKNIKYPNNKVFPVISNQKANDYLKEIGKILEFDTPIRQTYFIGNKRIEEVKPKYELLTTHCGRRTFVVNALRLGIPAEVIMRWTGHKNYEAMKPYVKIVDDLKRQEMNKFNRQNNK